MSILLKGAHPVPTVVIDDQQQRLSDKHGGVDRHAVYEAAVEGDACTDLGAEAALESELSDVRPADRPVPELQVPPRRAPQRAARPGGEVRRSLQFQRHCLLPRARLRLRGPGVRRPVRRHGPDGWQGDVPGGLQDRAGGRERRHDRHLPHLAPDRRRRPRRPGGSGSSTRSRPPARSASGR